jgi:hypothetical protein
VLHNRHFGNHEADAHSASGDAEPVSSLDKSESCSTIWETRSLLLRHGSGVHKEGLEQAMKTAAENAGIARQSSRLTIRISFSYRSHFRQSRHDKPKLKEQIQKMPPYAISGGVGDEITYAMNIVGHFPPNVSQRIWRRMMLREAVLHEKLVGSR